MTRPHSARVGIVSALWVAMSLLAAAQRQQTPTPSARSVAPVDLTGYWVSVVSTEWRYRMMTPPKGDYEGIPLTPAARKIADTWDPVRDTKAGEQCRAYGAPAIMHLPGRLHITWADDMTLRSSGCDRFCGSSSRVVTISHCSPRVPGTTSKYSVRSAFSPYGTPLRLM